MNPPAGNHKLDRSPQGILVIGASLGGLHAIPMLLGGLTEDFPLPIAVVQHRHKGSNDTLCTIVQKGTKLKVRDAEDKEPIVAGNVYFAPADYHLQIEESRFSLSTDAVVHYSRPSVDVLFESASEVYREMTIGVVLTGGNQDGANGAAAIKRRGGVVVVEDPASAEAPSMPKGAIEATTVDRILRLEEIAPYLMKLLAQRFRLER